MQIKLNATGYPLAVSTNFINMLEQRLNLHDLSNSLNKEVTHITVKFTDPKYSEKPGGYHPTDVQLAKQTDGTWYITTICDYCNVSHTQHPHFAKDLTFDFTNNFYHNIGSVFSHEKAVENFDLWQTNLVYFVQTCGVYDTDIQMYWTPSIR